MWALSCILWWNVGGGVYDTGGQFVKMRERTIHLPYVGVNWDG